MKKLLLFFISIFSFNAISQNLFEEKVITSDYTNLHEPQDVNYADIDGDGDMDLLTASTDPMKICWYENLDGLGNFGTQQIISDIFAPNAIYAGDMDGDGDMDVIAAHKNGSELRWYKNLDGNGTFGLGGLYYSIDSTYKIIMADLDGDFDLDILVSTDPTGGGAIIAWHENLDGLGTLGEAQPMGGSQSLTSIAVGDLDGDNDLDVIYGTSGIFTGIYWLENTDGLGNFLERVVIPGIDSKEVCVADIDNDSDLDIISAGSEIVLFKNLDGQGNFDAPETIATEEAEVIYAADFNGDNFIDIVTGRSVYNISYSAWYENLGGSGTFGIQQIVRVGGAVNSIIATDLNGDAFPDVAATSYFAGTLTWSKNLDGQGDFGDGTNSIGLIQNVSDPEAIAVADLDGDGDLDLMSASSNDNKIAWYENVNEMGGFGTQKVLSYTILGANFVYPEDIDSDGDMDLVYCGNSTSSYDQLGWFENIDGSGPSYRHEITTDATNPVSVVTIDIDNDGDKDILQLRTYNVYGVAILMYENLDGLGGFGNGQILTYVNDNISKTIIPIDLDGDLDIDIVYGNGWYENDGLGNYTERIIPGLAFPGDDTKYVGNVVDVDGDGFLDILYIEHVELGWCRNLDGLGNFGDLQPIAIIDQVANRTKQIISADFDNDGDSDVAVSSYSDPTITWFENLDGIGTFGTSQSVAENVIMTTHLISGDIDGNGTIDILSASDENKIAWHKNMGTSQNEINGIVRIDDNGNGCDSSDSRVPALLVTTDNGFTTISTFTTNNGIFQLFTPEGLFQTSTPNVSPYFQVTPETFTSEFIGVGNISNGDFCIQPIQNVNDADIAIYSLNEARPGFIAKYQIVYTNNGTNILNGSVSLSFDDSKLSLLSTSEPITAQTSNSLTFEYLDLQLFETRTIDVNFNVATPPISQSGDILNFESVVEPISDDNTPEDNTYVLQQTIVNSFDPNDIQVLEGSEIFLAQADGFLHYIIRFQNLGTASAINVRVENVLDPNLNWESIHLENTSHNVVVSIIDGNQVSFNFENINLPFANNNEPESHGFVQYKIKPINTIGVGDMISNSAEIYFDYNPAIITNTVTTTVIDNLGIDDLYQSKIELYPNPAKNQINIKSDKPIIETAIYNQLGQLITSTKNNEGIQSLILHNITDGLYFIQLYDIDLNYEIKKIIVKH